jgi:hypothetical protein
MTLLQGPVESKLLHLVSTPVAIMAKQGLRTYAGVTGDDPANARNIGETYLVLLSIYGYGKLLGRIMAGTVGAHEHYFVDIDAEVEKHGWAETASLCVVHRIPTKYVSGDRLNNVPVTHTHKSFSMYRTVVQYAVEQGGMGSVIYETPPNFNMVGKKPHFLSFSNKIYLHEDTDSHLAFLNYSVSLDYVQSADVNIEFRDAAGACIGRHSLSVPAMDFTCIRVGGILPPTPSPFVSFTAASITSALIPISVVVHRRYGGVSVEHSHPPQEYLMADWPVVNGVKLRSAETFFGG